MFFEEHPWLLVPIIIAVVEAWTVVKAALRRWLGHRRRDLASSAVGPD